MPDRDLLEEYRNAAAEAKIPVLNSDLSMHLMIYLQTSTLKEMELCEQLVRLMRIGTPDWKKSKSALLTLSKNSKLSDEEHRGIAKLLKALEPPETERPVEEESPDSEKFSTKLFFLERMLSELLPLKKPDWQIHLRDYLFLLTPQEMELSERLVRWMRTGTPDWEKSKSALWALSKNSETSDDVRRGIDKLLKALEPPETCRSVEANFIEKTEFLNSKSSEVLPLNTDWRARVKDYLSTLKPEERERSERLVSLMVAGAPHGDPNQAACMDWEQSKAVLLGKAKSLQTSAGVRNDIAKIIEAVEPPTADTRFGMSTGPTHLIDRRTPGNSYLVSQLQTKPAEKIQGTQSTIATVEKEQKQNILVSKF